MQQSKQAPKRNLKRRSLIEENGMSEGMESEQNDKNGMPEVQLKLPLHRLSSQHAIQPDDHIQSLTARSNKRRIIKSQFSNDTNSSYTRRSHALSVTM